ncbi:MAG TPA: dienelactone hydrolase family protein [Gemmataceae bacterium]|nr:dienelactone hydrolase family protein [Gemmataceae bacterium]
MLRYILLAILAGVPLLGCSRSAPPATAHPAAKKLQPMLERVAYLEQDKTARGFLCRPGGEGPYPAVVMIHDCMGLTDGIKDQTYHLAGDGYVVLTVDLYRGKVAQSAKEAERLEHELSKERALRDLKAAVDYLMQRPDVRKMHKRLVPPNEEGGPASERENWDLGVVGLGMGGTFAMDAALKDPRLRALVLCYCLLPADAKQLAPLNASVFCIVAGKDKSVPAEMIRKFGDAMGQANKRVPPLRVYGECQTGFLDPSSWPIHGKPRESDVEDAWKLIEQYLSDELK